MTRGNFWFERAAGRSRTYPAASSTMETDAVVVGGGIAGLSAARRLREHGLDVVLLEAKTCGAGATGHSSGFMTPDSELSLHTLVHRFGGDRASTLWQAAQGACDGIRADTVAWNAPCDVVDADSIWVARTARQAKALHREHAARGELGFESRLHDASTIRGVLGSSAFVAGIRVPGTFGFDAFAYAAALRDMLADGGLRCFESSPVVEVGANSVRTERAEVRARLVVLCLDRYAPDLGIATRDAHHVQAFLTVTESVPESVWASIFPSGPLLVWDSDLVYHYVRGIGGGRMLVGGGRLLDTFSKQRQHSRSFGDLEHYARTCFPVLGATRFTHSWSGLLGLSKDLLPIAGPRPGFPSHHLAVCGAGLPWSALAGRCAADLATGRDNELAAVFSPARRFNGLGAWQGLLGKSLTWAISYHLARR